MILHRTVILDAIWIILEIWRIGSSNLEGNFGGTLTISLSEFLQNKIGMVGAYRLGFIRGFRNAILVILAIWRNRSSNLEEPILQVGGTDPPSWRNRSSKLEESILQVGGIDPPIWRNQSSKLEDKFLQIARMIKKDQISSLNPLLNPSQ